MFLLKFNKRATKGFSMLEMLAVTSTMGVATAMVTPNVVELIDKTEKTTLSHARASIKSSLSSAHAISFIQKDSMLSGGALDEIKSYYDIEGFGVVERSEDQVVFWSTAKSYCFVYNRSTSIAGKKVQPTVSQIDQAASLQCAS